MTEQAALIAAVNRDPESDTLRLIFADWLDDHGVRIPGDKDDSEPMTFGEFIRAHIEFPNSLSCAAHWDGERWLYFTGSSECPEANVVRGFPHTITCSWADWLTHERQIYWRPVPCERCKGEGSIVIRRTEIGPTTREFSCPTCHGSGEVLPTDECKRCADGRWHGNATAEYSYSGSNGFQRGVCVCNHTGRIPRECPITANPLEEVRLTTWPSPDGVPHTGWERGGILHASWWEGELAARWPRLRFVLPDSLTDSQRELAAGIERMRAR